MSLFFKNREGHTPIDQSIIKDLKQSHVQDMSELYELETLNIAEAIAWTRQTDNDHLDHTTWLKLHKKMLCDVWSFAGTIRKSELANPDFLKPYEVRPALKELEQDLKTWIEFKSYSPKEMMAIFHERTLTIHPFRDGNGRWSRILTEFICAKEKIDVPTWGSRANLDEETRRTSYIRAIKKARHELNYEELIDVMWA